MIHETKYRKQALSIWQQEKETARKELMDSAKKSTANVGSILRKMSTVLRNKLARRMS